MSVPSSGVGSEGSSARASISSDGRFIAFQSTASDLVAGDTNAVSDVFVHDRTSGTTRRVSISTQGVESDLASRQPSISGNGRHVAFESDATNLVALDQNRETDIFVHDLVTGVTTRASVDSDGGEGSSWSSVPSISFDGRYVAFHSHAPNLIAHDANGTTGDIFVRDRVLERTELVTLSTSGNQANYTSQTPSISLDGRFVVFESYSTNLINGIPAPIGKSFIYLRDRVASVTQIISVGPNATLPNGSSEMPSVSADGRYVVFRSRATNLGPEDENGMWDVYLRDRTAATMELVSVSSSGEQATLDATSPSISPDGAFVVFASAADSLVPEERETFVDVFLRDRSTSSTSKVSVDAEGGPANGPSGLAGGAAVTAGAQFIVFHSLATNLADDETRSTSDVFVRHCGSATYTSFCAGTESACPCANAGSPDSGSPDSGCENSFSTGGAALIATGVPSVTLDTLTLSIHSLPPVARVLFFQGDAAVADGLGSVLGDGLRCADGAVIRLGIKTAVGGSASLGEFVPGDGSISVLGALPEGGGLRHYQAMYRDGNPFCTSSNINLSNGVTIEWQF